MQTTELEAILEKKSDMRREAYDRRADQDDKKEVSKKAVARFMGHTWVNLRGCEGYALKLAFHASVFKGHVL